MLRQVLSIQTAVVLVCTGLGWALIGAQGAVAVAYGAGISLAQVLALAARARYAVHVEASAPGLMWMAVLSLLERLVLIAGLMLVGLGVLHLKPAPLLLGLVAGQVGFLWCAQVGIRPNTPKGGKAG